MEVIQSRSPYIVTINEADQTATKLELYIWHKGETEPTTPMYTLTGIASSPTQRANSYNIAPFIKENIDIINPPTTTVIAEENNNNWCYCKVSTYATVSGTESLVETTYYIGLNGYTTYTGGYNQTNNDTVQLLTDSRKRYYYLTPSYTDESYFNLLIQEKVTTETISIKFYDSTNTLISTTLYDTDDNFLLRVRFSIDDPDFDNGTRIEIVNDTTETLLYTLFAEPVCETKYTPVICSFINRFGGWEYITFFKAKSETYDVKSKDYSLLPDALDYNPLRGQKQKFNFEGKRAIKLNTGWVAESMSDIIEQLFNSETILLDNVPSILKSSNFQIKTHLKDRVINYELDFEYNFNTINNVQ
jgi:hypothetical protein